MFDYVPMDHAVLHDSSLPESAIIFQDEGKEEGDDSMRPVVVDHPTDADLDRYARAIKEVFGDGFQWADIASMLKIAVKFLNDFDGIDVAMRKDAVIGIFDRLIDITDTPYLPDRFFDPLFKSLLHPFADLVVSDDLGEFYPTEALHGMPSDEMIEDYCEKLLAPFEDGFQWRDLGTVMAYSMKFAAQFVDLTHEERTDLANSVVDYVIDNTDTPYLPDHFSDPVFKATAHPFVEMMMESFEKVLD